MTSVQRIVVIALVIGFAAGLIFGSMFSAWEYKIKIDEAIDVFNLECQKQGEVYNFSYVLDYEST